jgi:hypothetical protein
MIAAWFSISTWRWCIICAQFRAFLGLPHMNHWCPPARSAASEAITTRQLI